MLRRVRFLILAYSGGRVPMPSTWLRSCQPYSLAVAPTSKALCGVKYRPPVILLLPKESETILEVLMPQLGGNEPRMELLHSIRCLRGSWLHEAGNEPRMELLYSIKSVTGSWLHEAGKDPANTHLSAHAKLCAHSSQGIATQHNTTLHRSADWRRG